MKKRILLPFILMFALAGCQSDSNQDTAQAQAGTATPTAEAAASGEDEAQTPESNDGPATIKVAGSTSVAPLMKELAEVFEDQNAGITVEIQETGSSAGINATVEGAAHLGMSSRDLSDEEIAKGLMYTEIALDGIAVIVNTGNGVSDLTEEQIAGIFAGEIINWSEVGGNDAGINVISREEGSGTRGAFEELLGLDDVSGDAMFENSTGAVKLSVSNDANAIGYISLGSLDDTVSAVQVGGVECTADNVKNKSYAIARPFLVCSMEEYAGTVKEFMDFILSGEGQAIVLDNNYIDIN